MMASGETIQSAVEASAAQWPERVALQMRSGGQLRTYTYAELLEGFKAGEKRIKESGVQAGDRVVLISENSPEWAIAYLAALAARTTVVPLDPKLTPADLAALIETSDPRAVLLSPQLKEKLAPEATLGLPVLNIEDSLTPFAGAPTQVSPDTPPTPDPDEAIASVVFTSGTNAKPKGVLMEHSSILHNARQDDISVIAGSEPYRVLGLPPLHHISGLMTITFSLLAGATVTLLKVVRGDTIIAAMKETRTSVIFVSPRLLELFYSEIHRQVESKGLLGRVAFHGLGFLSEKIRDLTPWNPGPLLFRWVHEAFGGNLKVCICGGAPLSIEVERALERVGFTIVKGYGLTETAAGVVYNTVNQHRLGHMGKPLEGVEVRIEQASSSSGEGEICVRGPALMRGYFRNPEATREAMRDGWFHTGDVGRLDPEGNLIVTGRIKELIVTAGAKKAAPTDVEQYYQGLPGVRELAVVGILTAGSGDEIHAAVVLDREAYPAEVADTEALRVIERAINARAPEVPPHLRIQGVHQVDQLPKTTTLKVKRAQLQQQIAALIHASKEDLAGSNGKPDSTTEAETVDEIAQRVIAIVTQVARHLERSRNVKVSSTLQFDLALDSLGLLELAAKVEAAFGIQLDKQIIPVFYTVGDLIEAVRTATTPEVVSHRKLSPTASPLVAIQPEGKKPLLCCVHPVAGVVFPYYELARLLGKDQPFYALQSVGLHNQEQSLTQIEDMAAHYIESLRQVQPEGPFFLAGWSLGAFIAFEMAWQLQQAGQPIALLALLDTPALSDNKISNFWKMSRLVLPAVVQDIWPYVYKYFEILSQEKTDSKDAKSGFKLAQMAQVMWASRQMKDEQQAVLRLLKVTWANSQALNNYTPKVYSGKITLLTTENQLGKHIQDQTWSWSQLTTGGVEVHPIPGNHMNILSQPYVQTLALKLEDCLDRAQQEKVILRN